MENIELQEQVLCAWVSLNGILKNSRMTKDMTYNEAIVMRTVLSRYKADGVGITPVQLIIKETNMLKSLVNRTLNSLCDSGYLKKRRDDADRRSISVVPVVEKLPEFLMIHNSSLELARNVIEIIGEEDAVSFVRICNKISHSELMLPNV